eukprot:TRINITY_DN10668_c0_g1_i1.p1 TRINITY_DN10668_c0_g1~~TRINITY_DN10668_c0_g1_i1.p1  ORF type:complete len:130 (-),score=40.27 TRINITY_DN10668_c0_g1_i1:46-435(-)
MSSQGDMNKLSHEVYGLMNQLYKAQVEGENALNDTLKSLDRATKRSSKKKSGDVPPLEWSVEELKKLEEIFYEPDLLSKNANFIPTKTVKEINKMIELFNTAKIEPDDLHKEVEDWEFDGSGSESESSV